MSEVVIQPPNSLLPRNNTPKIKKYKFVPFSTNNEGTISPIEEAEKAIVVSLSNTEMKRLSEELNRKEMGIEVVQMNQEDDDSVNQPTRLDPTVDQTFVTTLKSPTLDTTSPHPSIRPTIYGVKGVHLKNTEETLPSLPPLLKKTDLSRLPTLPSVEAIAGIIKVQDDRNVTTPELPVVKGA
ncbi:MAG TPA: hypothetical protein VLG12_03765 [Candidatus Saccharimonadales bacterium]|nr:hypothetical protein [Candidatus Saccharimonadales bacterium]